MKKLTNDEFISKSMEIHGNKYNYSLTNFLNVRTQIASDHLRGHEPKLIGSIESIGVKTIKKYLNDKSINYIREFCFKDCKHLSTLYFDFYLPKYNLTIEYDGRQHFESVPYFGGETGLQKTKVRDKVKNEYVQKNNISLFRICYLDDIIYELDIIFKNYDT